MKEHLADYENIDVHIATINDERIPEIILKERIMGALCKLQKNSHYAASDSEDTLNDYVPFYLLSFSILKCNSLKPSTSSQTGFILHEAQSISESCKVLCTASVILLAF